jgi:hypothetical protein
MPTEQSYPPPSAPATVFLSYARKDEEAILPLERALQERGLRVLRDKPNLPLGAHTAERLVAMISTECDAVLFYVTDNLLRSDFIWRYEVPASVARWRQEPNFHIIPVLQGVDYPDLKLHCADRGLPSLTDFNAEKVVGASPTPDEIARIARRTLDAALTLRLRRETAEQQPVVICLRSFPYTPPVSPLHLDLDWTAAFAANGPSPEEWRSRLLPALSDVADTLARQARGGIIEAWLKARLPVAVALGYAWPAKGALALRLRNDQAIWSCSGPSGAADDLLVTSTMIDAQQSSAVVEVVASRETTPAVTLWRKATGYLPGWRVVCTPVSGPSRNAIAGDEQARAWARRIGDEVRRLWDAEAIDEIHLFIASPVEFAVMVGQQLRDRHPVHVYFGDSEAGYRLACTLGPKGT